MVTKNVEVSGIRIRRAWYAPPPTRWLNLYQLGSFFRPGWRQAAHPAPALPASMLPSKIPTRLWTSSAMVPLMRGTMRPAVHAHLGFVRNYCEPAEQDREQRDNGLPPSQNEEKVIRMRWNRLRSRTLAAGDCRRFRSDAGEDPPNRSKGVSKTTQR
jgi:hypothetical protein